MKVLIIEEGFLGSPEVEVALRQNCEVMTAATVEIGLEVIYQENPDMVFWGEDLPKERAETVIETLALLQSVAV